MNNAWTKISLSIAALLLASFWPAPARAQAETAPEDYNKAANMAPVTASNVKPDFKGSFDLPNQVQCHGHKLAPGKYILLVKTVGESKMLTLRHEGGTEVVVQVKNASPSSAPGQSAVMVRHGPGPSSWTLEGIYVENLNMVFTIDESGHSRGLDKMFASVKRLPIS